MKENRSLPILSSHTPTPTSSKVEEKLSPEALVMKIAEAFLKITYPLSEEGVLLRDQIKSKIEKGEKLEPIVSDLPTVENPHPELFAGFVISPEDQEQISMNLACIQTSKGCRHKCTFCAAGSAEKVTMMPFPALLKIAEAKKPFEEKIEVLWDDWVNLVKEKTGIDLLSERGSTELILTSGHQWWNTLKEAYAQHPLSNFFPFDKKVGLHLNGQPVILGFPTSRVRESITNYYDSDPFDYRDSTFLHLDGTPADYGDVVKLLADPSHPIHITTAGWRSTDTFSKNAARKVAELDQYKLLSGIRISINPYELQARKNMDSYRDSMLNVIDTLKPVGPEVLLFDSLKDPAYTNFVLNPIEKELQKGPPYIRFFKPPTSLYSGPMADSSVVEDDHHDVMSCLPGYHIWPDGTIAFQKYNPDARPDSPFQAPKGSRPTPTGQKMW